MDDPDAMFDAARTHALEGRSDEALRLLDEMIITGTGGGTGDEEDLEAGRVVALALLTRATVLIDAERIDEAVAAGERLVTAFTDAPEEQNLSGIGAMLLDLLFLLLARDQPGAMLAICGALIARLGDGAPPRQAVAAGALFYRIQALTRLGRLDEVSADAAALHGMGLPALAALDRIARQFGPESANPLWHAQIMLSRVWVLLALGRTAEALAVTHFALGVAERYALPPQLTDTLRELETSLQSG